MADNRDLVNTIIAEAGGGGKPGIIAATWAIAQRAAARGQTMDQVIRSGFDGFTNPGPGSVKAQQNQALRNQVEQIIQGVQRGDIPNPVPGADHFLSGNANPSWSKGMKLVATIDGQRYYASGQVPKSAQGVGLPPGELPSVASLLDTQRAAPTPAIQSPNAAFLRQNTSPLGENTGLQAALQKVATTKANQVTPAIRRPELPAMGTPDLGSVYAGIYPQQQAPIGQVAPGNIDLNSRRVLTDGVGGFKTENSISIGTDQGEVLIPTVVNGKQLSEQAAIDHYQRTGENLGTFQTPQAADRYAESLHQRQEAQYGNRVPNAVPQSQIERNTTPSIAPKGNLAVDPGAIEASVGALRNSPLKAALARIASGAPNVPQSQIERGTTPITPVSAPAVAPKPRVTISTPFTTPQSNIERGAVRTVAPSTIGQPPATRVVQSIPMPTLAAAATSIPQSYAGQDGGAPRIASAPDRLAPSKGLPELFGNAAIGGADIMRFGVPSEVVAPVPAARPATFRTELRPMQISNPAWKPTPAVGTPMSGGLSRDAVALRAKGLAQAQAMAQVPRMITVQRPVQVAIQPRPVAAALAQQPLRIAVNGAGVAPQPLTVVQQLRAQGLSPAAAYAAANGGSGSINNSDAASRINGSSSRGSGGARSLLD